MIIAFSEKQEIDPVLFAAISPQQPRSKNTIGESRP